MYKRSQRLFRKKILTGILGIFLLFWLVSVIIGSMIKRPAVNANEERMFTTSELSDFNGTKPDKPIYLAYEGLVYDVTPGYKYYATGGIYHFLAGRDATADLHIAGGDIIKRKYRVVGMLKR